MRAESEWEFRMQFCNVITEINNDQIGGACSMNWRDQECL